MRPWKRPFFRPRPFRPRLVSLILALGGMGVPQTTFGQQDPAPSGYRHRVLNPLDEGGFPPIGAWKVTGVGARPAQGVDPKLGTVALEITGMAQSGGKVDAVAFNGALEDCRRLSLWVRAPENANVRSVGFQVADGEGEWLMQTVPVDWEGWKRIDIDPTAGGMKPAYKQPEKNGQVDLPLKSVHVIFFAKETGPVALQVDGLTAVVKADPKDTAVTVPAVSSVVIEPDHAFNMRLIAENPGSESRTVKVDYTVQVNAAYIDPPLPDPVLGYDEAVGTTSTVSVDGEERGDARLTDGNEFTHFEPAWGGKYQEVVATIDLGQERDVTAVHWLPGDANWIFKADLSTSLDGSTFQPVRGAQNVDMHQKWQSEKAFPWPGPLKARHLRLRFHKDGETVNIFRLPPKILVYDGIGNDEVNIPTTGQTLISGSTSVEVPGRDFAELRLEDKQALGPGAYLLGMTLEIGDQKEMRWSTIFVAPDDVVDVERTRRFGINTSAILMAQSMRRAGFGWVRFENAKWQMYMPEPGQYAFDGSVQPWGVNLDGIFETYHNLDMNVLPYVFQPPAWETSAPEDVKRNRAGYPPKDPAAYGEAIFQLVARFGTAKVDASQLKTKDKQSGLGLIQAVELWNEPNLNDPGWGPFVGTMAQYFEVMRAGVEGSRRADPSLPVSAAGFAGIDLAVIGQLAEYKYDDGKTPLDLVDIINGHFYSGRQEPEITGWDPNVDRQGPVGGGVTYPEQLADLVAWRDQLKPEAEIWITETGNDVGGPIGLSERHQAAKVPRVVMLALASGIDKVFIYREAGSTPSQHAGAGLLRNDGSLRPSWVTVATMIRQLAGFEGRALRLPSADPDVWMFLWEEGDRRIISAWTLGEAAPLGIELGAGTVCDAFGRKTELSNTAETQLSYFPIYITLDGQTPALTDLSDQAQALLKQRDERRRKLGEMPMHLFDFGPSESIGVLKGYGLPRRFVAVGKDMVWDQQRGYGFASPGISENDRRWIKNPLERDDVRIGSDNAFQMRLEPGKHVVRINAAAVAKDPDIEVTVTSGEQTQTQMITADNPVVEFTVTAGKEPVSVSLEKPGGLRWISAMPEAAVNP